MRLTDALRGEHAILYEIFAGVRETLDESDEIAVIRTAVALLERNLMSHAAIEDEILFPELDTHIKGMGPLEMMRSEHQGIDEYLEAIRNETDVAQLKKQTGQLLELAFNHFQKEEMALFGMAEQFLSEDELTALGDKWASRRKVDVQGQSCMAAS
ncbi:MAG: hemerythrin domain-containing protein [Rhodospirillaceae bacterium]|jgi:hemerythrin-like domain-containing protein|nr:hemerythrin domain-containing protein [Rhodospirillaceae bacterium]MBT5939096.1 hemerythrin domain-containing protein [Rhodospirillaceae bacterium]MBT7269093.1 hemerythrin domain-containing protein [Rhodospirillaceae bacterium]